MVPVVSGFVVRRVAAEGASVVLDAESAAAEACCPVCGTVSGRVHDSRRRRPLDLPWRGHPVRVVLTVRRFVCAKATCARRTFAEDFGDQLGGRARRTPGADAFLLRLVRAAGAEAGARLATAAGLAVSPDTLLRLERRAAVAGAPTPRVLGVDDFALRRGRVYATLLVDLETRRPVDVLDGREAGGLVAWLNAHPGVEVVARDRAEAYADGATQGAPGAVQVSDRFHLVRNAGAAFDALLRGRRRLLDRAAAVTIAAERTVIRSAPARPPSPSRRYEDSRRAARLARWERAHALRAQGLSVRAVARALGVERSTARNLLAWEVPPHNQSERPRPGGLTSPILGPFVPYLQDRWQAGCTNATQLFREIAARGYAGSRSTLAAAIQAWRTPPERVVRRFNVRWLCLRSPEKLDEGEREALARVLAEHPDIAAAHGLLGRFRRLVAERDVGALDTWVGDARASGLAPFEGFANGLSADRAAIEAAFRLPWSTGPVEGHVHRLKLIKRRGYGRAKLDLLRARVLAA